MTFEDDPDPQELQDALEELTRSKGYGLVTQRITAIVETKKEVLEAALMVSRPNESNYTRGMIAGMKLCLSIPAIMTAELRDDLKALEKGER